MDTSETYIKMCEKAWKFLKPDIPIGELLFSRRLRMLYVLDGKVVHWRESVNTSNSDRAFPLLEQDQLQEMIGNYENCLALIDRYDQESSVDYDYPEVKSMEQLWLAFVMKEKYSKVWSGAQWEAVKVEV